MPENRDLAGARPKVSIIVLNYNGRKHLEYCIPSLLQTSYDNFHLLVVDNNSKDDSLDFLRGNHPEVEILKLDRNYGWAAGNNRGIEHAVRHGARHILLANNDIKAHPEWVSCAVEVAAGDPAFGVVGFDVYGRLRPDVDGLYEKACERWRGLEFEVTDDFIDGMAMFVPVRTFEAIGKFDETYFMYSEETDFEVRCEAAGFKRVVTNVPVWHHSQGTSSRRPLKHSCFAIRNMIRLAIKNYSLKHVLGTILFSYTVGCNPFFRGDMTDVTIQRGRPRGVFFNFGLITYCVLWNLLHLGQTLASRKRDYDMVRRRLQEQRAEEFRESGQTR